jgi:hypothetical protein
MLEGFKGLSTLDVVVEFPVIMKGCCLRIVFSDWLFLNEVIENTGWLA